MSTAASPRLPAYQIAPNAIWLWTLQGAISSVVLIGAALVLAALSGPDWPGLLRLLATVAPYLAVAYAVVAVLIRPRLRYRTHRWEVTAEAVFTLPGWLEQQWTIVPVARIQTVDINRGAMQRMFGLASVAVLTASSKGTVLIEHLDAELAGRVAPDLATRAAAVRDEAT
ncbi:PH domain-containing protein [soil metagenome]